MTTNKALSREEFETIINDKRFKGGFLGKPNARFSVCIASLLLSIVYLQLTATVSYLIPIASMVLVYIITGIIVSVTKVSFINDQVKNNNIISRARYWYKKYYEEIPNPSFPDACLEEYDTTGKMSGAHAYAFLYIAYTTMAQNDNKKKESKHIHTVDKIKSLTPNASAS